MDPHIWFFRGLRMDRHLSDTLLVEMRDDGVAERWGHMASIHRHHPEDAISLILSGGVRADDGAHSKAVLLRPGDVFGALTSHERDALVAHDETELLTLPRERFESYVRAHVPSREGALTLPVAPLLHTDPTRRLARALMHWAQGEPPGGELVTPRITMRGLSRLVGLDRARTRESLTRLVHAGALERRAMKVRIRDLDALGRTALTGGRAS